MQTKYLGIAQYEKNNNHMAAEKNECWTWE